MLNYKVKNTPNVEMPHLDPVKLNRKGQAGQIDIAPPEETFDDDEIESVDDPMSKRGKKTSHLRDLNSQNKKDAQKAIQSILTNNQTDKKINSMISEALNQKEGLIVELEKELEVERARRETMNQRFEQ